MIQSDSSVLSDPHPFRCWTIVNPDNVTFLPPLFMISASISRLTARLRCGSASWKITFVTV